ncbi:hypothetical protein [Thetidibacter halocola]|uniref:Restriction endonuclease n=1 Tax=Thetidibacter halocola TaxID=2827239 RepID=A0A8J7WHD1_9RHOB|nr:hypothetical protein [Thetidibacter halocola]MBS0125064.1 hypothetical protein [Thetidibacter halocola]
MKLIDELNPELKQKVFDHLRTSCVNHPLEREWNASAEVILDAIAQSSDLTQRGVKGVIADRAFHRIVVPRLQRAGWTTNPIVGDLAYDADLSHNGSRVTVQVKMQRRERGQPKERFANGQPQWVVEVQKTRTGQDSDGASTRPYAFGNFDILAVNLYASSGDWSHFVYTVAKWLLPRREDVGLIAVMQPVSQVPSDHWTEDFDEAVEWLHSEEMRRLPAFDKKRRKAAPQTGSLL